MVDSVDQILGQPSADEILGPAPETASAMAFHGADMDEHFSSGSAGQILDWFGQGFRQGWGAKPLGLSSESETALKQAGIFADHEKANGNLLREFNEALIRPAATAIDLAMRLPYAAGRGLISLGGGAELLGAPLVAGMEAFPAGHLTGFPRAVPVDLARASALGVIGKGEAGWKGVPEAVESLTPGGEPIARPVSAEAFGPPAEAAARDVHGLARQIAPDSFAEYDALAQRKESFRDWLDELRQARAEEPEVKAASDRVAEILDKVAGVEERLTNAAARRLETARQELDRLSQGDTPQMALVRRQLLDTDIRMRELAPEVSAAYRSAAEQMPEAPREPAAAEPAPDGRLRVAARDPDSGQIWIGRPGQIHADLVDNPAHAEMGFADASGKFLTSEEAFASLKPAARRALKVQGQLDAADYELNAKPAPASPEPPAPAAPASIPVPPGDIDTIAREVSQKLTAADRPRDEAEATAALVAAHYQARAERFQGALGTPLSLYRAEGPEIRGGQGGSGPRAAAGKSYLKDSRTVITLFQKADASTFVHETGHQWLEELLRDGEHPQAPAELKADVATLRGWLGTPEGEIPRAAHERFARGFEAYLMEGRAPSPALAGVFAKFKEWLLAIYNRIAQRRVPIDDAVRGVYDRLVGSPEQAPVIAAERELPLGYDEAHTRIAETVPPEQAGAAADIVEAERERAAQVDLPESVDAERRAQGPDQLPAGEAGEGARRGALGDHQGAGPEPSGAVAGGVSADRALGPGGGQIAAEGAVAPARPAARAVSGQPESAYLQVPKPPVSLIEFLQRAGGLKEDNGELHAIDAHKAPALRVDGQRKRLVEPAGLPLDEAALQAWEAGYFPEFAERPTPNDLLDALDAELRGQPRYSERDAGELAAYQTALAHNREVDRLAGELGIDPRDWTKEQFWNMAAEHLAGEKLAAEQKALDDAREAEFAEAERRAKAWAESRGDAWEPDSYRSRTQEDLEREAEQEAGAGSAGAQPRGAQGTGSAAGDRGALQERGGQGGSAAGARRGGNPAGATEPPANPAERFRGDTRLIDKAGNIRLDNLNQPDDILQAIRDSAARNSDFLPERRGTLTDGEVLDLADALGRDPAWINRKKLGEAFNAEEIIAIRLLAIRSATAVRDLMANADPADPAAALEFAQAAKRNELIQDIATGKLAQATAEWGRAGRSFRRLLDGEAEAAQFDQFLRDNSGRTLYQIQEMMRLGKYLPTPQSINKFISSTAEGRIRRAIIYYWVNALISGPITHARYSVGNALNAFWTPLIETPIAAAVGAAREAAGLGEAGNRVYLGEAGAQLYGLMKGSREGWSAAQQAFKTGVSPLLPSERVPATMLDVGLTNPLRELGVPRPIAEAIGIPGRSVAAIHSFFKAIRYEQNIQGLAYRQAMIEKLAPESADFADRVAELSQSPTEAMMTDATKNALKELYMSPTDYHSAMGALTRATNNSLPLKIMMPFLKIGSQITRNAFIERTPLGLASSEVRGNLFSGAAAGDLQAAKITAGVGLAGAMVLMTLEGLATGDGPSDPAKRAVWQLNHRPNSLTIGPVTIPYQGLGHLGMLMRFAANMTETAQHWDSADDGGKLAVGFMEGVTRAVLDENFMRGVKDLLDAVYHPEEYGNQYLKNFASNWLPYSVGLGQVARAIDPYSREQRTILDAARARIPGLSMTLEPRRDRFGEPIHSTTGLPQLESRYAADPTVKAMEELHLGIGRLEHKIRGVELSPEQYDDYARIAGRLSKMRLDLIAAQPGWAGLPAPMRIEIMHKAIDQSREAARAVVMMQSPGIIGDAVAAKTKKLGGAQ